MLNKQTGRKKTIATSESLPASRLFRHWEQSLDVTTYISDAALWFIYTMYTREKQGGHIVGGGVGSLRLCLVVFFEPDKIFRDVSGVFVGFFTLCGLWAWDGEGYSVPGLSPVSFWHRPNKLYNHPFLSTITSNVFFWGRVSVAFQKPCSPIHSHFNLNNRPRGREVKRQKRKKKEREG